MNNERNKPQIKVLIVDDSAFMRTALSRMVGSDPDLWVAGTAASGAEALQKIASLDPDVITLDVQMPGLDGLATLRRIMAQFPRPVIMVSSSTEKEAGITFDSLEAGAFDYVPKQLSPTSLDILHISEDLLAKIKGAAEGSHAGDSVTLQRKPPRACGLIAPQTVHLAPAIIALGVSTGGPKALQDILPTLPDDLPVPILVVQHMPPLFTRLLAERLNESCQLKVKEAKQDDPVEPGTILLAPGDFHMKVVSKGGGVRVSLDQTPQQNSCRPAVDPLFASAAEVFGGAAIAVVLTGMGRDGLRGAEILKARGARIIVQDEASSVVWGMPGAVVNAGLADRVLPLDQVVAEILTITGRH